MRRRDRLRSAATVDAEALAEANARVRQLMLGDPAEGIAPLSGEAAAIIADARAGASEQVSQAAAKVRGFSTEVAAFSAAPLLYKQRKFLEVYTQLDDIRKFLILGDPSNLIIEYTTAEEGGLDRVLSEGTSKPKYSGG